MWLKFIQSWPIFLVCNSFCCDILTYVDIFVTLTHSKLSIFNLIYIWCHVLDIVTSNWNYINKMVPTKESRFLGSLSWYYSVISNSVWHCYVIILVFESQEFWTHNGQSHAVNNLCNIVQCGMRNNWKNWRKLEFKFSLTHNTYYQKFIVACLL